MNASELTVDARGLKCPLPVLRVRKAMKELASGAAVTVLATDPAAPADVAAFCEAAGHALVDSRAEGDEFIFVIRKG